MASDWITWNGGDCPVPAGTPVEVRYRDGEIGRHKAKVSGSGGRSASQCYWENDRLPNDIVAYRIFDPKCEACDTARCDECVPKFPKDMKIVETNITPEPAHPIEVTLGCCKSVPCQHPGIGPCDMPIEVTAGGTFILPPDDHRLPQQDPVRVAADKFRDEQGPTTELTEREHFMVEAALADGFKMINDDGDVYMVTDHQLVCFAKRMMGEAVKVEPTTATYFLDHAKRIQQDRAKEYEQAGGERSTARVVAAFNAITGRDLRESEGWLFLQLLKMVRGESKRVPHMDSIYDNVSYAALYGEARSAGR